MRVVLTHPSCWPYVRRGSERAMEDWSLYLMGKGHDVMTLAGRPQGETLLENPPHKALKPIHWRPWLAKIRIQRTHCFFFTVFANLLELNPDVVHSCYFYDSLAASLLKRKGRFRTILQMNGVPIPGVSAYRHWPPEGRLIAEAIHRADHRIVCSAFVGEIVRQYYGADSHVILPPVNLQRWNGCEYPRADPPVILGIADFNQRRKGIRVLIRAFADLKNELPDVRLRLSGYMSKAVRTEALNSVSEKVRSDIEILGVGEVQDIPKLYQEASVTVLASMWEPSGAVMMESWASGTPVVATRHGGLPEYFGNNIGYLFDPQTEDQETHNASGLAEAIYQAIKLCGSGEIRERCRAHAGQFSTDTLGPKIESLYRQ
jgi:glycosyltransferase involved in cell wall biosynthesis